MCNALKNACEIDPKYFEYAFIFETKKKYKIMQTKKDMFKSMRLICKNASLFIAK
jgi:hypothetical protein